MNVRCKNKKVVSNNFAIAFCCSRFNFKGCENFIVLLIVSVACSKIEPCLVTYSAVFSVCYMVKYLLIYAILFLLVYAAIFLLRATM